MLNGFGYALFGVPSRDLETTWHDVSEFSVQLNEQNQNLAPEVNPISLDTINSEAALLSREISVRRFAKTRLYTGGRILHIVRRKKTELEKKTKTGGCTYEMRWAVPDDFSEFKVMPRMLLDHLPDNVFKTLSTILEEQKATSLSSTTL